MYHATFTFIALTGGGGSDRHQQPRGLGRGHRRGHHRDLQPHQGEAAAGLHRPAGE